jgi:hypothetical protein
MDAGAWATVVAGAVGTLLSGAAAAWVLVSNARHKNRLERDKDAVATLQDVCERQEAQLTRLEAHSAGQQEVIGRMQAAHAECEGRLGEIHGWMLRYYDYACREAKDPARVPAPPPRREPALTPEQAEFLARNTAQGTLLAAAARPPGRGEP